MSTNDLSSVNVLSKYKKRGHLNLAPLKINFVITVMIFSKDDIPTLCNQGCSGGF